MTPPNPPLSARLAARGELDRRGAPNPTHSARPRRAETHTEAAS
jgi:hypothetical protein